MSKRTTEKTECENCRLKEKEISGLMTTAASQREWERRTGEEIKKLKADNDELRQLRYNLNELLITHASVIHSLSGEVARLRADVKRRYEREGGISITYEHKAMIERPR
jgi:hypothetical protein